MREPRRRRYVTATLVALLIGLVPAVAQVADPEQYDEAIAMILCDCGCPPQSAKDCACGRGEQIRETIRSLVAGDAAQGRDAMTAEAVIALYVEQKGEQVRIAPTSHGFNLVAWLGPFVVLFGGGAGVLLLLRRWLKQHPSVAAPPTPADSPDDEPYRRRLQQELERMK